MEKSWSVTASAPMFVFFVGDLCVWFGRKEHILYALTTHYDGCWSCCGENRVPSRMRSWISCCSVFFRRCVCLLLFHVKGFMIVVVDCKSALLAIKCTGELAEKHEIVVLVGWKNKQTFYDMFLQKSYWIYCVHALFCCTVHRSAFFHLLHQICLSLCLALMLLPFLVHQILRLKSEMFMGFNALLSNGMFVFFLRVTFFLQVEHLRCTLYVYTMKSIIITGSDSVTTPHKNKLWNELTICFCFSCFELERNRGNSGRIWEREKEKNIF